MPLQNLLSETSERFEKFYWETDEYKGRTLGIEGYKDFVHTAQINAYKMAMEDVMGCVPKEAPGIINNEDQNCSNCGEDMGLEMYDNYCEGYDDCTQDVLSGLSTLTSDIK